MGRNSTNLRSNFPIIELDLDIHPINVPTKFDENRTNTFQVIERTRKSYGHTDGRTDGRTDRRTEATTIPFGHSGRGVKMDWRQH